MQLLVDNIQPLFDQQLCPLLEVGCSRVQTSFNLADDIFDISPPHPKIVPSVSTTRSRHRCVLHLTGMFLGRPDDVELRPVNVRLRCSLQPTPEQLYMHHSSGS